MGVAGGGGPIAPGRRALHRALDWEREVEVFLRLCPKGYRMQRHVTVLGSVLGVWLQCSCAIAGFSAVGAQAC